MKMLNPAGSIPYRKLLNPNGERTLALTIGILVVHYGLALSGFLDGDWIPGSILILWVLPILMSGKEGRRELGFRFSDSFIWIFAGPIIMAVLAVLMSFSARLIFGDTQLNWLVAYAGVLDWQLGAVPSDLHPGTKFWILTVPAMLFLSIGLEIIYRGYVQLVSGQYVKQVYALIVQAFMFSVFIFIFMDFKGVQAMIGVVPVYFFTGFVLGWIVQKGRSIWISILSHMIFILTVHYMAYYHILN